MKPNYLMRCARFKYKTLLDKGGWEAPDNQEKEILTLCTEINGLKSRTAPTPKLKSPKSETEWSRKGKGDDPMIPNPGQRNYSWQLIAPKDQNPNHSSNTVRRTIGAPRSPEPLHAKYVTSGSATSLQYAEDGTR